MPLGRDRSRYPWSSRQAPLERSRGLRLNASADSGLVECVLIFGVLRVHVQGARPCCDNTRRVTSQLSRGHLQRKTLLWEPHAVDAVLQGHVVDLFEETETRRPMVVEHTTGCCSHLEGHGTRAIDMMFRVQAPPVYDRTRILATGVDELRPLSAGVRR